MYESPHYYKVERFFLATTLLNLSLLLKPAKQSSQIHSSAIASKLGESSRLYSENTFFAFGAKYPFKSSA